MPIVFGSEPQDRTDSLLVNDGEPGAGGGAAPKGRTCFVADTTVYADGKFVKISEVSGSWIEEVQAHEGTFDCRDVVLENGACISVVDAHKFMNESGEWVAAQDLTSGLKLKTQDGSVTIKSVSLRSTPYTGTVYNLKVKDSNQYMVGKDKVIVRDW
jgi:hypothetical protein